MRRRRHLDLAKAIEAAFQLLRRPLTLFGWGVVMMAPLLLFAPFVSDLTAMSMGEATDALSVEPTGGDWLALQMVNNMAGTLQFFLGLLIAAWATKVTIQPRAVGFGLGMDELRYAVVVIGLFIVAFFLIFALTLIGVGVGAAAWSQGEQARIWAIGLYVVAAVVLIVWFLLRTALMAPMSVAMGTFAIGAGWRATAGQVWKLLGLMIVLFVLTIVLSIIVYLVVFGVGAGVFYGFGGRLDFRADSLADVTTHWSLFWIALALAAVPAMWAVGLLQGFGAAALASAAADLTPRPAEPAAEPTPASSDPL